MAKGFAPVLRLFLAALLAVPVGSGAAAAQDPKAEAKARFTAGQSHYNLNEFNEALREFKEGYRIYSDPVFLYNLGQCERQLNHYEEAIRFYRSFLRNQPKAPNKLEVQRKIEEMEAALKAKPAVDAPAEPGTPPKTEPLPAKPEPAPAPTPATPAPTPEPPIAEPTATPAPPPAPPPAAPAAEKPTSPGVANLEQAAQPKTESPAFYTTWWFWTATGVVLAGAATAVVLSQSGSSAGAPQSELGGKKVF